MNLPRNPALLIWPAVLVAIVLLSFFASLVSPYDP